MAEGLEEESKKSLQMEAELEKQLADFDTERQQMRSQLAKKEERYVLSFKTKNDKKCISLKNRKCYRYKRIQDSILGGVIYFHAPFN